jgi:hypothetical protein
MRNNLTTHELLKKWGPTIDEGGELKDRTKRIVTATLMENHECESALAHAVMNEADAPINQLQGYAADGTGIARHDPVLIAMVRRSAPQLMAYDVCGVQPLSAPSGLIFAMKARYGAQNSGNEALFNEADTDFSGVGTHAGTNPAVLNRATPGAYTTGTGMDTQDGERRGSATGNAFGEMSFTIEKISVESKTRTLKTSYTQELAQDMRALHGLDADSELTNILSNEIASEINREIMRTIYVSAKMGAAAGSVATAGTFDLDVDSSGRWSVEKFKGLMFQIERDANAIGQDTRRGRGNFLTCSADIASALQAAGMLDYAPAIQNQLMVDDTVSTFAGILNGRIKVFVDPYAANFNDAEQFYVVGYKGVSSWDAGLYYCPYTMAQFVNAIDPATMQPVKAVRTRYGKVNNPFATLAGNGNSYFRRVRVLNLM